MKELFLLIFCLKTILLSPVPVELNNEWVVFKPSKPLTAITGGAALYVSISEDFQSISHEEIIRIQEMYPEGTIEAQLIMKSGGKIDLKSSGVSYNNNIRLIVSRNTPIPTAAEFVEVKIKSNVEIKNAKIYWKNGKS